MRRVLVLALLVSVVFTASAAAQRPPRLLLDAKSGTQRALQESYCVSQATAEGSVTGCADTMDRRPTRFLRVQARERLTFRLRRGTVVDDSPIPGGLITVYRLSPGEKQLVRRIEITATPAEFRAPRRPGRYEVEALVDFTVDDGRSGDTTGSFGIRVPPPVGLAARG